MLKKILIISLFTSTITQPHFNWAMYNFWNSLEELDLGLSPEWIHTEFNDKRECFCRAKVINIDGRKPAPWYHHPSPTTKLKNAHPFSEPEIEQLIKTKPVLLVGRRDFTCKTPACIKNIEEIKNNRSHFAPKDFLLFHKPDQIPEFNNLPRFDAKALLTTVIRNSLRK